MRLFIEAHRWLFLAILVFAPWAYGCTRPWTIDALNGLLGIQLTLWIATCIARRWNPFRTRTCVALTSLILVQAAWMVFNAQGDYNAQEQRIAALEAPWSSLPGSIERNLSLAALRRYACLLGVILFACDLSIRNVWRRRLWLTLSLTGVSIVLLGLVQRVGRAPMIFWEADRSSDTFFATFLYHANAGAFINLILPLVGGYAVLALGDRPNGRLRLAFWISAFVTLVAGAFVNISRAAQVVTLILFLVLLVWHIRHGSRMNLPRRFRMIALVIGIAILLPVALLGWSSSSERWAGFASDLPNEGRLFANRTGFKMATDAGALGFGPGTFRVGFPFYIEDPLKASAGTWRYAHNDFLQTYIEWGWLGSSIWALLYCGGLWLCLRACNSRDKQLDRADRVLQFSVSLALLGIALHATVDFPLQIASLQLYTATLLGLAWSSPRWRASHRPASALYPIRA